MRLVKRHVAIGAALVALTSAITVLAVMAIDRDGTAKPHAVTHAKPPQAGKGTEASADLYTLEAKSGWVRKVSPRKWELYLQTPRVVWFADRPGRASGPTTVAKLISAWPRLFYGTPPNGSLTAPDAPDGPRPTTLILRAPRVDQSGVMSFSVSADEGTSAATTEWFSRLTKIRATATGGVSLFIDDSSDEQTTWIVADTMTMNLVWRPDLSQCAGYGTNSVADPYGPSYMYVTYETNASGWCFFRPTYARFDAYVNGTREGTITFDGHGNLDAVTSGLYYYATGPPTDGLADVAVGVAGTN